MAADMGVRQPILHMYMSMLRFINKRNNVLLPSGIS